LCREKKATLQWATTKKPDMGEKKERVKKEVVSCNDPEATQFSRLFWSWLF
jgi:hypothetical protein